MIFVRSLAKRWCGSPTPVKMLRTEEPHLPPARTARRGAPLSCPNAPELRRLGCEVGVGWVVRPTAGGRRRNPIYGAYISEAGDAGRTEAGIARLKCWRRDHNSMLMWVSVMSRADGSTLRDRPLHDEPGGARTAM